MRAMADRSGRPSPHAQPRRIQPPAYRRLPQNERFRTRIDGVQVRRREPLGNSPLPLPVRILLGIAILALGSAILLLGSGYIGPAVGGLGDLFASLGQVVTGFGSTAAPTSSIAIAPDAPRLVQPVGQYTNKASLEVHGYAPANLAGKAGYRIRVYVNAEFVSEAPIASTLDFAVEDVPLAVGQNQVTATVLGPNGESSASAPITVTYDATPPPLSITAPKNKSTVNGNQVHVTGKTQAGSAIVIRNETTGLSATGAAADGTFSIEIQLDTGANALAITSTDPAGNARLTRLTLTRAKTMVDVQLKLSQAHVHLASLPTQITISATATDPTGLQVTGATVDFTLSLPGLPTTTYSTTSSRGKASWTTSIPKAGVVAGSALVTVLVTLADGTEVRQVASFPVD
jgi:hypothetical protein